MQQLNLSNHNFLLCLSAFCCRQQCDNCQHMVEATNAANQSSLGSIQKSTFDPCYYLLKPLLINVNFLRENLFCTKGIRESSCWWCHQTRLTLESFEEVFALYKLFSPLIWKTYSWGAASDFFIIWHLANFENKFPLWQIFRMNIISTVGAL